MEERIQCNLRITRELKEQLDAVGFLQGQSGNAVIARAVEEYLRGLPRSLRAKVRDIVRERKKRRT